MMVTRQIVGSKLVGWLRHELTLEQLVDWAENALQEADFDPSDTDELVDVVGRLGLADVRAFGLTWEDCEMLLHRLGFRAHVEIMSE
jgi:hypothetical protein